jgi:hypothetical protein
MVAVCIIPSPSVVRVFEVVRKVFAYAVNRPAREVSSPDLTSRDTLLV